MIARREVFDNFNSATQLVFCVLTVQVFMKKQVLYSGSWTAIRSRESEENYHFVEGPGKYILSLFVLYNVSERRVIQSNNGNIAGRLNSTSGMFLSSHCSQRMQFLLLPLHP